MTSSLEQKLAEEYPGVSEVELKTFKASRAKLFKATIAVCVLYGSLSLGLFLLAVFTERGRDILSNDLVPFIVTLVAGMILIIILLLIQIYAFKPKVIEQAVYDKDICPDYWRMEETPEAEIPEGVSGQDRANMKRRCVPEDNVFNLNASYDASTGTINPSGKSGEVNVFSQTIADDNKTTYASISGSDAVSKKLCELSKRMYKPVGSLDLTKAVLCDKVYPHVLAQEDAKSFPSNPNSLRCKYAKTCGIPWSAACP